jgi:predicted NBD/HSP70 family sugar kinase
MASLPQKATHQQTRAFNQQLVLRAIYDHSVISRAEIARLTGLTRTSVSELVGDLLRTGLAEEVGRGPSTGGKAPILLDVPARGRHIVGLDLGESAFSGAVVDLRGTIMHSMSLPLDECDGDAAVDLVFTMVDGLLASNGSSPTLGIGIGAPGLIDTRTGTVHWAVNLNWADLPLGELVSRRFGLPVVVANDSHAAAVAELTFGPRPRPANLVVVRVGRGIGAGIILNGRLFQGDGSGAGEIGHTVFDGGSEECHCGRVGCLETVASMTAMVEAARRLDASIIDEQALITAMRGGNTAARDVAVRGGEQLGRAIAALISALNIDHVLLIGPATELGDDWLAAVRRRATASVLPLLARNTHIEIGAEPENVVLIGAAALLMTHELGLSLAR